MFEDLLQVISYNSVETHKVSVFGKIIPERILFYLFFAFYKNFELTFSDNHHPRWKCLHILT